MNRSSCMRIALMLPGLVLAQEEANSVRQSRDPNASSTAVSLVLGGLKVTDQRLELRYQVRNNSGQDIWVCNTVSPNVVNVDKDGWILQLLLRERRDIDFFAAAYIRVCPGQARSEVMSLRIPIIPDLPLREMIYATSLAIEIGFYTEDLPRMIYEEIEKGKAVIVDPNSSATTKGSSRKSDVLTFSKMREIFTNKEKMEALDLDKRHQFAKALLLKQSNPDINDSIEKVGIPFHIWGPPVPEQIIRIKVEGVRIPCGFWKGSGPTVLERLQGQFFSGDLDLDTYREAEQLLTCDEVLYDDMTRKLAEACIRWVSGETPLAGLEQMLGTIASKKERDQALVRLREKGATRVLKGR